MFDAQNARCRFVPRRCPMHILQLAAIGFVAAAALQVPAAQFSSVTLNSDGSELSVLRTDGTAFAVPKSGSQDEFRKPAVSADGRYAGWLALYPNQGASYSQPLYLAVLDTSGKVRRFSGDFGMVYGWCFAPDSDAVIYQYQFPHGATPIGFEMRRLKGGKLIRRVEIEPVAPSADEAQAVRTKTPAWTACAQRSAAAQ